MAKRIVDEEMRFTVIINGNEAQKELLDLEKSTKSLTATNKQLRAERAQLQKSGKRNTAEYKKLTLEIKANSQTISVNKTKMAALQKQIGITGLTMRQLRKKASLLRLQLNNMVPGSALFKKLETELKAVNTRLTQLKGNARATQGSLSKLAGGFNKFQAVGFAAIAMLTGFVLSLQKVIDYNGKLADAMSNVQKTTGLTKNEVEDLTKSFGLLQTRTNRIDLLKIAEQGGRIGIVKEEIKDFVRVMNVANVALGDSFTGGVEEVSAKLGKLKFLFKETKDLKVDEAYNAIGSALNELGASGNSTEANITEFALRLGALPDALKPSITETLALGAVFEESGVQAEIAARAYSIFVTKAATNTEKFAEVMGLSKEQVQEMINTDPLKFFLDFSKGLQGMDATDVAETLKYLGVNATGVQKALGAAANNSKRFAIQQELANKAAAEGVSLLKEYEIKNNNLAAVLEKVSKRFRAAFSSEVIVKGLTGFVEWFAKFIGASEDADGKVTKFRNNLVLLLKVLLVVGAAILSNTVYLKLDALWKLRASKATWLYTMAQKANTIATNVAFAATQLYAAATMLLTGNIKGASQAMRVFSATMKSTPWGLVAGLIGAIVAVYFLFSKSVSKASVIQKMFNDIQNEASKSIAKERSELDSLLKIAKDDTISKEKRLQAIKRLNQISPEYLGNITLETINTADATTAINKYIEALNKKALSQAIASKKAGLFEDLINKESKSLNEYKSSLEKFGDDTIGKIFDKIFGEATTFKSKEALDEFIKTQNLSTEAATAYRSAYKYLIAQKEADLKLTQDQIDALDEFAKKMLKEGKINVTDPSNGSSGFILPTSTNRKSSTKKDPTLALLRKNLDLKNQLIQDDFERELAILETNSKRKIAKLREQLIDETGLKGVALAKAKFTNKAINDQILLEAQIFQDKQETIALKYIDKDLQNQISKYDQEEKLRRAAFELELAEMDITAKERKAKQEKFDKAELISRAKHTQEVIDKVKAILASEEFQGIDLELLTEEQKQAIVRRLEELGISISEINKLLAIMRGKSPDGGINKGNDFDILGFTVDQWEEAFKNLDTVKGKIELAAMAVQGFMNAWSRYNEFATANERKRLAEFEKNNTTQQNKLKQRLDAGLINQRQYDAATEGLERQLNKRKAEAEYKQAKRQKDQTITGILLNTSLGIIRAVAASPLTGGMPWAAIVAALGAFQTGIAVAAPLPSKGFEKGYGYGNIPTRRLQDGKLFNAGFGGEARSGFVNKPTVFMAGEQGKNFPELIVSGPDLKKFNPDVTQSLANELARVRGFESGYTGASIPQTTATPSQDNEVLMALVAQNTAVLADLRNKGVIALLSRDMENTQRLKEDLDKLKKYRNKSAI